MVQTREAATSASTSALSSFISRLHSSRDEEAPSPPPPLVPSATTANKPTSPHPLSTGAHHRRSSSDGTGASTLRVISAGPASPAPESDGASPLPLPLPQAPLTQTQPDSKNVGPVLRPNAPQSRRPLSISHSGFQQQLESKLAMGAPPVGHGFRHTIYPVGEDASGDEAPATEEASAPTAEPTAPQPAATGDADSAVAAPHHEEHRPKPPRPAPQPPGARAKPVPVVRTTPVAPPRVRLSTDAAQLEESSTDHVNGEHRGQPQQHQQQLHHQQQHHNGPSDQQPQPQQPHHHHHYHPHHHHAPPPPSHPAPQPPALQLQPPPVDDSVDDDDAILYDNLADDSTTDVMVGQQPISPLQSPHAHLPQQQHHQQQQQGRGSLQTGAPGTVAAAGPAPLSNAVFDGSLQKREGVRKKWTRYDAQLAGGVLCLMKEKRKPYISVNVRGMDLIREPDVKGKQSVVFTLQQGDRAHHSFRAATEAEFEEWIDALRNHVNIVNDATPRQVRTATLSGPLLRAQSTGKASPPTVPGSVAAAASGGPSSANGGSSLVHLQSLAESTEDLAAESLSPSKDQGGNYGYVRKKLNKFMRARPKKQELMSKGIIEEPVFGGSIETTVRREAGRQIVPNVPLVICKVGRWGVVRWGVVRWGKREKGRG